MSFLFINKTLKLNTLKTRTAMHAKIPVFLICVEAIIYLLLLRLCVTQNALPLPFLFFLLFLLLISAFGQTGKSYLQIFIQLLLWARVTRIRVHNMICRVLLTLPMSFRNKQYLQMDWSDSIWNFPFQWLLPQCLWSPDLTG